MELVDELVEKLLNEPSRRKRIKLIEEYGAKGVKWGESKLTQETEMPCPFAE